MSEPGAVVLSQYNLRLSGSTAKAVGVLPLAWHRARPSPFNILRYIDKSLTQNKNLYTEGSNKGMTSLFIYMYTHTHTHTVKLSEICLDIKEVNALLQ